MPMQKGKDAPNLTILCLSIKSIQRDIMALNKPASHDMIVINESAFIATIATISINRVSDRDKKERFKCTFKTHEKTACYGSQCARFMHTYNVIALHRIASNVIAIVLRAEYLFHSLIELMLCLPCPPLLHVHLCCAPFLQSFRGKRHSLKRQYKAKAKEWMNGKSVYIVSDVFLF